MLVCTSVTVCRDLSKIFILNVVMIALGWNIGQWFSFIKKKREKENAKAREEMEWKWRCFYLCQLSLFLMSLLSPQENVIQYGVHRQDALKSLYKLAVHLFIRISPWHITYRHEAPQATHKKKNSHKSNWRQLFHFFTDFQVFFFLSVTHRECIFFLITHRGNTILYAIVTLFIWQ